MKPKKTTELRHSLFEAYDEILNKFKEEVHKIYEEYRRKTKEK